jgi:ferrochelatase
MMPEAAEFQAVLLLQMGAPGSLEDITPFLERLFSDPAVIPLKGPGWFRKGVAGIMARSRTGKVAPRYREMGGGSPLVSLTLCQASALEEKLAASGMTVPVRAVMRYCSPDAGEVVGELTDRGVQRFMALSLYPQYSSATTASSLDDLKKALEEKGGVLTRSVERWGNHSGYTDLLAEWIKKEAEVLREAGARRTVGLFSAHNLPQKLIQRGDPYLKETRETAEAVSGKLEGLETRLSFQSSIGPVRWLEPTTDAVIDDLAREGIDGLILVPISFVSDHIETLHDMDRLYRRQAEEAGIEHFSRLRAFNDHPDFIALLARLVTEPLEKSEGR